MRKNLAIGGIILIVLNLTGCKSLGLLNPMMKRLRI